MSTVSLNTSDDDSKYDQSCEYTERSRLTASRSSHFRNQGCTGSVQPCLIVTTLVCIIGSSFQFGYNITVVNAPENVIKKYFTDRNVTMSDFMWSTSVSILPIGGMLGALIGPTVADLYGRKSVLLWNSIITIVGCILMFLSHLEISPAMLIVGRFVVGINNGITTVVVPLYLTEISPTHLRGALGTLNQFGIVTGTLFGNILSLKKILGTSAGWGYALSFSIVPAVLQALVLPFCPESPRYLFIKLNQESLARKELRKLQGSYNIQEVIMEMKIEKENHSQEERLSIWKLFKTRSLYWSLLISCSLQISQQLSGINSVLYYSTSTFKRAGIGEPDVASCGFGIISVAMVLVVVFLVEKWGRRTLMLAGLAGMFVSYGFMTLGFALQNDLDNMKYLGLVFSFILMAFFQIGPGPIPWFMMAELFAQGPRPAATSVSGGVNWFANFIVGITFPKIQSLLYPYVFVVYMGLIILFFLFIYRYVPETKGKTFDEISEQLKNSPRRLTNHLE